jgi:uncharacterized phage protein (TIGR01671 family)
MRELKFRAWIEREKYMATQGEPDLETLSSFMHHYSDNSILMQYTGLKDKNGKEIYEGDVLNFKANYTNKPCGYFNGIVVITPLKLILKVGDLEYDAYEECEGIDYLSEITGNIYENQGLL